MIGHIESYNEKTQTGVIKHQDKYYEFHIDQWNNTSPPQAGDDVDFDEEDGVVTEVEPVSAYLKSALQPIKKRRVAATLGLLFGAFGMHRFYLGFYNIGILQILVTYLSGGYGVMWGFIEAVLIITGHIQKDAKGRPLK